MTDQKPKHFNIIRYAGERDTAVTSDGITVHRQKKVWLEDKENSRWVACAPDDDHFVFIDPLWTKIPGRWFAYCSCGSPAILVGSNQYKQFGSPAKDSTQKGEMLICKNYMDTNQHYPVNWSER